MVAIFNGVVCRYFIGFYTGIGHDGREEGGVGWENKESALHGNRMPVSEDEIIL